MSWLIAFILLICTFVMGEPLYSIAAGLFLIADAILELRQK